jgi:hypothetical protein
MALNISTNTAALRAGSYLSKNNSLLQKSLSNFMEVWCNLGADQRDPFPLHNLRGCACAKHL